MTDHPATARESLLSLMEALKAADIEACRHLSLDELDELGKLLRAAATSAHVVEIERGQFS